MSDQQIVAIIAAIVGHGNLGTKTVVGAPEHVVKGHVETAKKILKEAKKW